MTEAPGEKAIKYGNLPHHRSVRQSEIDKKRVSGMANNSGHFTYG